MPDATAPSSDLAAAAARYAAILVEQQICRLVPEMDRCFGCDSRHAGMFLDSRTHKWFCGECTMALLSWEFDGCPDDPDFAYRDWIAE